MEQWVDGALSASSFLLNLAHGVGSRYFPLLGNKAHWLGRIYVDPTRDTNHVLRRSLSAGDKAHCPRAGASKRPGARHMGSSSVEIAKLRSSFDPPPSEQSGFYGTTSGPASGYSILFPGQGDCQPPPGRLLWWSPGRWDGITKRGSSWANGI